MNRQYVALAKRIRTRAKAWEGALEIRWIRVEHVFIESYHDEDHSTIADTDADWQYRTATIRWFLPSVTRLGDQELEEAIVHEYVHVLLSPMESKVPSKYEEQAEFAVESIARAIVSASKKRPAAA